MTPPSGIHAAAPPQGPGPGSTGGQQGASLQQGDGLEPGLINCGIPAEHLGGVARAEPGPLNSFGDPPPKAPLLHLSPLMSPRSAKGPCWGLRSPRSPQPDPGLALGLYRPQFPHLKRGLETSCSAEQGVAEIMGPGTGGRGHFCPGWLCCTRAPSYKQEPLVALDNNHSVWK